LVWGCAAGMGERAEGGASAWAVLLERRDEFAQLPQGLTPQGMRPILATTSPLLDLAFGSDAEPEVAASGFVVSGRVKRSGSHGRGSFRSSDSEGWIDSSRAAASQAATSRVSAKNPRRFGSVKSGTATRPRRRAWRSAAALAWPSAAMSLAPPSSGPCSSSNSPRSCSAKAVGSEVGSSDT